MIWLILGVVLWSAVHFIPGIGIALKSRLKDIIGNKFYSIGFAICIVTSIVLMVIGWRSSEVEVLYTLPEWRSPVTSALMIIAFLLFGAAKYQTRIKRYVRHPQLIGVALWAIAHLISNGDVRSLVLFGGLGLWALIEICMINDREGEWVKPEVPSVGTELKGLTISLLIFLAAFFLHPYFAGVSPIPS